MIDAELLQTGCRPEYARKGGRRVCWPLACAVTPSPVAMPRVRLVCFDFDETLCLTSEHDVAGYRAAAEALRQHAPTCDAAAAVGAYKEALRRAPWDPQGNIDVYTWRAMHWAAALRAQPGARPGAQDGACTAAGDWADGVARVVQGALDAARLESIRLIDGVKELCDALRAEGRAVALITNGDSTVQRDKLRAAGVEAAVPAAMTLVGGEQPQQKPAASIFQAALALAEGVKPAEAIHVGDSLTTDMAGARNAGLLAAVYVNPEGDGECGPEDRARYDACVRSVLELPEVIRTIEASAEEPAA